MFITTGFIPTTQTRDICDSTQPCTSNQNCTGQITPLGEILSVCDTDTGFCNIDGWCPLEVDTGSTIVNGVENFTVFFRTSIQYDSFGVSVSEPATPIPGVSLFSVNNILGDINITECGNKGCMIAITIDWTCNLNNGPCTSALSFIPLAGGFNFRKVNYNVGQTTRDLEKLYGVRLIIRIIGTGARFSFFRIIITIGASAAMFTVATLITDVLLKIIFSGTDVYQRKKWQAMHLSKQEGEEVYEIQNQDN